MRMRLSGYPISCVFQAGCMATSSHDMRILFVSTCGMVVINKTGSKRQARNEQEGSEQWHSITSPTSVGTATTFKYGVQTLKLTRETVMGKCVICGKKTSTPSAKTCGPEHYLIIRRAASKAIKHKGQKYSPEARARNYDRLKAITDELLKKVMAIPESQRGPQNREAIDWILITPQLERIHVHNLLDWARKNADLFGGTVGDDQDADRIRTGFAQVKRSLEGKLKYTVRTYKGWSLEVDGRTYFPESKQNKIQESNQ